MKTGEDIVLFWWVCEYYSCIYEALLNHEDFVAVEMKLHVFLTSEPDGFIYGLFTDAVNSSYHMESNDKIINE
jgi:hypothetical protein